VSKWFAEQGGSWPIITDDDGSIATAFGVAKVPETWIIDPSGIVRARVIVPVSAESLSALLQRVQGADSP